MFHDRSLLLTFFRNFVLPVFEYACIVPQSCAQLSIHSLNYWTGLAGVQVLIFWLAMCNLAHQRSVEVLYMQFKIKSNPIHYLSCALPLLYAPKRVNRGNLVAHQLSLTPPRCRTFAADLVTFVPLNGTILITLCLILWDWQILRAETMLFFQPIYSFFLPPSIYFFIPD